MQEVIFIVIVLLVSGFALYWLVGARSRAVSKAFARLPVTTVDAVRAPGLYRLSGIAVALGDPPVSEASGRPYLARDLHVVASDGSESSSRRTGQQLVDFLLDDGTGTVEVHPDDGIVVLDHDFEAPRTTLDQVPWVDAFLRAQDYRNGSPQTCKIRIYEGVLQPGARIGVVGFAVPADGVAGRPALVRGHGRDRLIIRIETPEGGCGTDAGRSR